ncbi:MAG: prepilin-type N-terminal cleavage/methylation domain-containing protein [Halanaerobacter sp.]
MAEDGFSLVEVVIAIALIAVISTILLEFFTYSAQQLSTINHRIVANNLARLKLEEKLSSGYQHLNSSSFKEFSSQDYRDYQYSFSVNKLNPHLKEVVIRVKDSKRVRAKLITLITKEN